MIEKLDTIQILTNLMEGIFLVKIKFNFLTHLQKDHVPFTSDWLLGNCDRLAQLFYLLPVFI